VPGSRHGAWNLMTSRQPGFDVAPGAWGVFQGPSAGAASGSLGRGRINDRSRFNPEVESREQRSPSVALRTKPEVFQCYLYSCSLLSM
jgi:hypothetical protein